MKLLNHQHDQVMKPFVAFQPQQRDFLDYLEIDMSNHHVPLPHSHFYEDVPEYDYRESYMYAEPTNPADYSPANLPFYMLGHQLVSGTSGTSGASAGASSAAAAAASSIHNRVTAAQYDVMQQQHQQPLQAAMSAIQIPAKIDVNKYPDMTTLLNANSSIMLPPVESQFVDHKLCTICGKRITRDMSRHMRTHQLESRFTCKFPKSQCRHKSGKFNRPYDYKKHLLNRHFKFDDPCVKRLHNLSDKLHHWGTCPCGTRFVGKDWLDQHILTDDDDRRCVCIE